MDAVRESGNERVTIKDMRKWQKRLGLMDWRIRLYTNVNATDMSDHGFQGEAGWDEASKTAKIKILNPAQYGSRVVPFDEEETLVHELLHLKFALLDNSGNALQDRIVHQLIDDLARALIEADRAKTRT